MPVVSDYTAILSGTSWWGTGVVGKPVFLTYSFNTERPSYPIDFSSLVPGAIPGQEFLDSFAPLTAPDMTFARNALTQWADASGITFFEVPSGQGDLQFSKFDFRTEPVLDDYGAFAYFPRLSELAQTGDVVFGTHVNSYRTYLYPHEIGHALGLKHSHHGNLVLSPELDNWGRTVMTYNLSGPFNGMLGPLDIQAIQFLYGAPGSDGTQVESWSWDGVNHVLTQTGKSGSDLMRGVHVADVMYGGLGIDSIYGDAGNDRIYGQDGGDFLNGGSGADLVHGDAGNDLLSGDAGDDTLIGGAGNDTLDGGAGLDRASYADAAGGVTVNLYVTGPQNTVGAGNDIIYSIEWLIGSAFDDMLDGNNGDNVLEGGAGNDMLNGDAGIDTVSHASDTMGVSVNLSGGVANGAASGNDRLYGFENVTGGGGDDTLVGDSGDNILDGGGGSDTLVGGEGIDTGAFSGKLFDYTISQSGSSTIVSGLDGADTLTEMERLIFGDVTIDDAARIIVWKCVMPVRHPEFISFADQQAFEPQAPQFDPDWSAASYSERPLPLAADPRISLAMVELSGSGSPSLFAAG